MSPIAINESNGTANRAPAYAVHPKPGFQTRPMKVICIGAGLSGIYLGIRLPMVTENVLLVIYEKNKAVSGTWHENVYFGAACDVPAHRYCYTFEPNPNWSNFFAPAAEIQSYFEAAAVKYDAMKYIKLEHKVIGARWDEDSGKWQVKVQDGQGNVFDDECDVLINAMGVLNNWKWPKIPGLHDFKGTLLHSAAYDRDVPLEGKTVAVIGSGSSGIQIIPAIEARVAKLGAYLRSSTWIVPPFGSEHIPTDEAGNPIYAYSEAERKNFNDNPESLLEYRRMLEKDVSSRCTSNFIPFNCPSSSPSIYHGSNGEMFETPISKSLTFLLIPLPVLMFFKDDPSQEALRPVLVKYMEGRLAKKPSLAKHLIPDWPVGCRRLTPGIGYLEALCEDHVEPIFSDIAKITEDGITTVDGETRKYDVIICATGFDVSYGARFPFEGRDGKQLDEAFRACPTSYLAIGAAGFPNYFCFNGANAPVGAGSLVPATEAQGDYILKAINKLQRQDLKSMVPKDECVDDFVNHTDKWMANSVWSGGCRSWYKNGTINGRVSALWPGSGLHFISALEEPRWEDYHYTQRDATNRFSFFGRGLTELEESGEDRTAGLGERTKRMLSHPALVKKDVAVEVKAQKKMVAVDPAAVIMGKIK